MSKILIVCALTEETQGELMDYDVLYTGVGKINATYELTRYLPLNFDYDLIIKVEGKDIGDIARSVVEQIRSDPSLYSILPVASIVKLPGIISVYPSDRTLNSGLVSSGFTEDPFSFGLEVQE